MSPSSPIMGPNWKHDPARSCFILETHLTMDIDKIWALGTIIQHEHHEIVAHLLSSPNMDVNYQACEILIDLSTEIR